ncbi:MAG: ribonuclease J, partial [Geobacter sp.]
PAFVAATTESGRVFVDGMGVGDVGEIVLKDRRILSEDGMVVAIVGIRLASGDLIYGPEIVSRGVVYEDESQDYLEQARLTAQEALQELNAEMRREPDEVRQALRQALRRFFKKTVERRPMILPVIMEM